MEKLGYGPDNHLAVTVSTRNVAGYRDPAVILIDQLKQIYIDSELKPLDTTQWYPMLVRKEYKVALNVTETAVDDPDPAFYENYVCGAQRNYTGYCNYEVDRLVDQSGAAAREMPAAIANHWVAMPRRGRPRCHHSHEPATADGGQR